MPVDLPFEDLDDFQEMYISVSQSMTSYLHSLAGLQEAVGDNLECVMKELHADVDAEEE
jgi:hypothetical protein